MGLHLPPIGLLKWFVEKVERKIFEPYYIKSHSAFENHNTICKYWSNVEDFIEVSWELKDVISKKYDSTNEFSRVTIRSINTVIDEIELSIMADTTDGICSHFVRLKSLDRVHHTERLTNFPPLYIIPSDKGVLPSISSFWIVIHSITKNGVKDNIEFESVHYTPSYQNILNGTNSEKWGQTWNLDLIEDAKLDFRYMILGWGRYRSRFKVVSRILTAKLVLTPLFWSLLIFRLIDIDIEGRITFKTSKNLLRVSS